MEYGIAVTLEVKAQMLLLGPGSEADSIGARWMLGDLAEGDVSRRTKGR